MKLQSMLSKEAKAKLAKQDKLDRWDRPKTLLTITGFEAPHSYGRSGCNSESGLIELQSQLHEIEDMRVNASKGRFTMYLRFSVTQTPQGFARRWDRDTHFRLVVRKDKKSTEILFNESEDGKIKLPYSLTRIVDELSRKRLEENLDAWTLKTFANNEGRHENVLTETLKNLGYEVTDFMAYHDSLWISPDYIDVQGTAVEFGAMTNHTYHSLPRTYRFEFCPKVKTVKLADIGVEAAGYYDHHTRHFVKAEQADEAKAFASKFNRKRLGKVKSVG